jgi:RHS repeat-associated protein
LKRFQPGSILIYLTTAMGATLASAQCYKFSAPGITYTMNISSVTNQQTELQSVTVFSVQQVSTLTYGGKTYVAPSGPGTLSIESQGGSSTLTSAAIQAINAPPWQVDITLLGMITLPINALPASLPPISAWGQVAMLEASVYGVLPQTNFTITSTGSCSTSTAPGGVPGETLGDPSSQPNCPQCGGPIAIGTGNMFEQALDYHTMGANRLEFRRYYNSLASSTTFAVSLGANWRSNYDRYLDLSSGTVMAERPDGQQVPFTSNGGAWSTDADIDLTLTNSGSTWTLTDHHDNVETYTALNAGEAQLQTIATRNGYTQTLQYNSSNQLISVTDSYNRQLILTYSNGLLASVTTPDGLVLGYGFTSSGSMHVLTSLTYSTTPLATKSYVYENPSFPAALTGIIDENGARYMSWTYDSAGRALTSQNAGGANLVTVAYNDTDGSRTVTGPLRQPAVYRFLTAQNVPKVTEIDFTATSTTPASKTTYTYDANGYLASRTDQNGNVTNFVNNSRGMPTSVVEAAATPQSRTTTVTYHPTFRLPVQIVTPLLTANFTYDTSGNMLTQVFTDTNPGTTPYTTAGQTRTWTYTWANFLPASMKGPRTDVSDLTKLTYDASGTVTAVTNQLGQTIQVTQHLPGGWPLTIVDQNGVAITRTYDARQRLLSSTMATAAGPLTTAFAYDAVGNLIKLTLPDGSASNISYDATHRPVSITDLLGESINFTLDAAGNRTQMTFEDVSGATQLKRSSVYDALGRILQEIGGAGQTTSFSYDPNANITTTTDGLNHTTQRVFDALNRVIRMTDAAGGTTAIAYDALDRPVAVTDPNAAATQYVYDAFGNVIQETNPTSGVTVYRYDSAGNLTQRTDARGVVTNFTYDALNRRTSVTYPGNSAENVALTYDQGPLGVWRLTSIADAAGTSTRAYDERANLLTENRSIGAMTLKTSYTYDGASRVASVTYPSGWLVAYTRNKIGQVASVAATPPGAGAAKGILSNMAYQPFGPAKALTYGNGIAETRGYDADYRTTQILSSVQNLAYGYDPANNVLSIADGLVTANSQSFGYDVLNRLTVASGVYGKLSYGYDANGNRSTENSGAVNDSLGSVAALTYNQAGRLSRVSAGSQQLTQYTYDAFGHRLVKVGSATSTTIYQYGWDGSLLEESGSQGGTHVDYIYLNHRAVAVIQADGSIDYLHDDRLGTPQTATGGTQSVVWSTTYQPFGAISTMPALLAEDLRLPGQESDFETGLYHNGFRDYVPALGRYIESDPTGLAGGPNRYAYAAGNPPAGVDPSGLDLNDVQQIMQCKAMHGDANGMCTSGASAYIAGQAASNFGAGVAGAAEQAGEDTLSLAGSIAPIAPEAGVGEAGVKALEAAGAVGEGLEAYNDPGAVTRTVTIPTEPTFPFATFIGYWASFANFFGVGSGDSPPCPLQQAQNAQAAIQALQNIQQQTQQLQAQAASQNAQMPSYVPPYAGGN